MSVDSHDVAFAASHSPAQRIDFTAEASWHMFERIDLVFASVINNF